MKILIVVVSIIFFIFLVDYFLCFLKQGITRQEREEIRKKNAEWLKKNPEPTSLRSPWRRG